MSVSKLPHQKESMSSPTLDQSRPQPANAKMMTILFWNVENLFDDVNDPGWFDDHMVATGNPELYDLKIKRLQEILAPFTQKNAVLCFAEIENKAVLIKLLAGLPNHEHYKIIYEHNHFTRVKVAILSPLDVIHSEALDYARGQRPILRADLKWGSQKITIFVNHWKSRRGGTRQTEKKRLVSAKFLYAEIQKLKMKNAQAEIVVLGDFNDRPYDASINSVLKASSTPQKILDQKNLLYNCLADKNSYHGKYAGTISHNDKWQLFDQMMVSSGLLDEQRLFVKSCKIYDAHDTLVYNGRPNRFGGSHISRHQRGYSDHLPIVMEIVKK